MDVPLACVSGIAVDRLLRNTGRVTEELGPQATPYGTSQPISACTCDAGTWLFLPRFGANGQPVAPHEINYRANLYALREAGVQRIVAWMDSKAISHNYRVGQFVLIDDLIDETVAPPTSCVPTFDTAHIRQWPVFCPDLRQNIARTLQDLETPFTDRGVYVCVDGHRQETPAEVRKYASFGGDLIGRALAPEVFLAKELELAYASACYVSGYAEGGSGARPFERGQVLEWSVEQERVAAAVAFVPRLMERLLLNVKHNGKPAGNTRTANEPPSPAASRQSTPASQ